MERTDASLRGARRATRQRRHPGAPGQQPAEALITSAELTIRSLARARATSTLVRHLVSTPATVWFRYCVCCQDRKVKVRIRCTPREHELDGVRLDTLRPGVVREMPHVLASWLVAERYADIE